MSMIPDSSMCWMRLSQSVSQREWLRWGVGIGLLTVLVLTVGIGELSQTFRRASPGWIVYTTLCAGAWFFVGGFNVWLLLRRLAPIQLRSFMSVYLTSWAISLVVPGQLGDASQVVLLRRQHIPIEKSGAAYIVDKAISLSWMLLVAGYGVSMYSPSFQGWWFVGLALGGGLIGGIGVFLIQRLGGPSEGLLARLRGLIDHLETFKHSPGAVILNMAMTVVKWVLMAALYWATFAAFGVRLDFSAVATIPVMSSLVGYIPITVGGAGTTEWTAVVLFSRVGATSVTVLSVYLFMRGLLLLLAFCSLLLLRSRPSPSVFEAGEHSRQAQAK